MFHRPIMLTPKTIQTLLLLIRTGTTVLTISTPAGAFPFLSYPKLAYLAYW